MNIFRRATMLLVLAVTDAGDIPNVNTATTAAAAAPPQDKGIHPDALIRNHRASTVFFPAPVGHMTGKSKKQQVSR